MTEKTETEALVDLLTRAKHVAVSTGAGISAESGIPTFRGKEGLWKKYRAEELATPTAFAQNPELVWEFYEWRRGIIASKKCPIPDTRSLPDGKASSLFFPLSLKI